MPWEKRRGAESRGHGMGSLQYMCKHFISIHQSVTEPTVVAAVGFKDPEMTGYVLMAWQPTSGEQAVRILVPLVRRGNIHPNLRRLTGATLAKFYEKEGFPKYVREATADEQEQDWLHAALWLNRNGKLSDAETLAFLRGFVLGVRKENTACQLDLMLALRRFGAKAGYPVTRAQPEPVADWVATWRWALHEAKLPPKAAAAFLCQQMRTKEEIPDVVQRALLIELKQALGDPFPLKAKTPEAVDLETDWPTCGQWLVEKGYFGKAK